MEETITPLEEEVEAYHKIWNISIYFPIALVGGTILQFLIYLCYNRWWHPFYVLVADYKPEAKSDNKNVELQNLTPGENKVNSSEDQEDPEKSQESQDPENPGNIEVVENAAISENLRPETSSKLLENPEDCDTLLKSAIAFEVQNSECSVVNESISDKSEEKRDKSVALLTKK